MASQTEKANGPHCFVVIHDDEHVASGVEWTPGGPVDIRWISDGSINTLDKGVAEMHGLRGRIVWRDGDGISGVTINGKVLTWRELAYLRSQQADAAAKWMGIANDLDRCQHGRHEGDVCDGCGGDSKGNALIGHGQIGYAIDGRPIMHPKRSEGRNDPDSWRAPRTQKA